MRRLSDILIVSASRGHDAERPHLLIEIAALDAEDLRRA
jgi:hypothetical protein